MKTLRISNQTQIEKENTKQDNYKDSKYYLEKCSHFKQDIKYNKKNQTSLVFFAATPHHLPSRLPTSRPSSPTAV